MLLVGMVKKGGYIHQLYSYLFVLQRKPYKEI